jgi:hypothetical protein
LTPLLPLAAPPLACTGLATVTEAVGNDVAVNVGFQLEFRVVTLDVWCGYPVPVPVP